MIPFNDLTRVKYPGVEEAIQRVVKSGHFVLGPEVEAFEDEWARYCGVEGCVGVGNGTDALEIAMRALGIGAGDEVALVANAGNFASLAVRAIGAIPVYVDVREADLLIDPTQIPYGVDAIIVTHLYGNMVDVKTIGDQNPQAWIIEDASQAHGGEYEGGKVGVHSDVATFSFYPTKNLGAMGDAGAIVSSSHGILKRARQLRQYGWGVEGDVSIVGGRNSRMDEMQAAILRAKLPHLEEDTHLRRSILNFYAQHLNMVTSPHTTAHLCVLRSKDRAGLKRYLGGQGIGTKIHYRVPDHHQLGGEGGRLPVTESACREVLSLPCFPCLSMHEVERIVDAVQTYG